jgi:hypothetical protein
MFPPEFYNHGISPEGFLNFVLEIQKLRFMKHFIVVSDTSGKSWCINTDAIISVEDLRGQTAFYLKEGKAPIITNLKFESVVALLDAR